MISGTLLFTMLGIQQITAQTDKKTVNARSGMNRYSVAKMDSTKYMETAKIRNKINKYGVGKKVSVKLRDKTKYKGAITKIEQDTFTITNKAGQATTISFDEVDRVSKSGVPFGVWIAVGAGAAVGAILLISYSQLCRNEGGC